MKESVKSIIWLIISCILLLVLLIQIRSLEPLDHQITYIWQDMDNKPDIGRAYEMLEEEHDYNVTWWTIEGTGFISCSELSSEVSCPVLYMTGDPDICIMGFGTASRLFGDSNVTGLTVSFRGHDYVVESVSEDVRDLFAYTRDNKGEGSFDRLTLYFEDPRMKGFARSQVETLYEPDEMLDHDLICFILETFAAIIFIAIGFMVDKEIRRRDLKIPVRSILICIIWGAVLGIIIWIVKIPVDFIPGRWSDFDFWKELVWSKQDSIRTFISAELSPMDMVWVKKYFEIIGLEIISGFSLIIYGAYRGKN